MAALICGMALGSQSLAQETAPPATPPPAIDQDAESVVDAVPAPQPAGAAPTGESPPANDPAAETEQPATAGGSGQPLAPDDQLPTSPDEKPRLSADDGNELPATSDQPLEERTTGRNRGEAGRQDRDGRQRDRRDQALKNSFGATWTQQANQLIVANIAANGAAATIGLQPNDRIVSIAGRPIATQRDFQRWLSTVRPGVRVPIVVYRGGQQSTFYWSPAERFFASNPVVDDRRSGEVQAYLGVVFDTRRQDVALISEVRADSPAEHAGLQAGDIIVDVNGQRVYSPYDLVDIVDTMQPGEVAQLHVDRVVPVELGSRARQRPPEPSGTRYEVARPVIQTQPAPQPAAPVPAEVDRNGPTPGDGRLIDGDRRIIDRERRRP